MLRKHMKNGEDTEDEKLCGHCPGRYDIMKQKIECPFICLDAGASRVEQVTCAGAILFATWQRFEGAAGRPARVWGRSRSRTLLMHNTGSGVLQA